ncbi:MAG: flagellar motor protein MotB [Desulfobacterales bacterium]|nr:flagellar motor protein MotB [Desulfobacterales bacterium]
MNKVIVWVIPAVLITALIVYFVTGDRYKKLEEKYNTCQGKIGQTEKEKADLLAREQQNKATYDQLMSQLQKEVGEGQVAIQQYEDKLTVNVAEKIFFDSGSAELKPGGKELLKKFGRIVKGLADKVIRVEGHTDNVPIAKLLRPTYPTNWELSAARAITVVRFLQDSAGVPPKMLLAAAFGPYQPIAPNDTPANKQKNRRIEIVLQQRDVLKRTEAPIAPVLKGTPAKTEAPSAPVTKEAPTKTEAPAAPAK